MPQEIHNQPGSQLASVAPDGFESMDAYDAGLQAEEVEVPDDLMMPAETEEAAPTEEAAETEETEEQLFEVDGERYTAEQIQEALHAKAQSADVLEEFETLREQFEGATTEMEALKPYRELKKFFERNPDIRRKFESEIGEFEQLAKSKYSDDPTVAALQKQNEELMGWKREVEVAQANTQIDHVFDSLQRDYPDIVDEDFRSSVLNQVYGAFKGDPRFGVKTLAAAAKTTAHLMSKATQKATQNGTQAALRAVKKPGVVRLVPAGKQTDAKPKAKDYGKMSPDQLAQAFVEETG